MAIDGEKIFKALLAASRRKSFIVIYPPPPPPLPPRCVKPRATSLALNFLIDPSWLSFFFRYHWQDTIFRLAGFGTKVNSLRSMKPLVYDFIDSSHQAQSVESIAILYMGDLTIEAEWACKLPYQFGAWRFCLGCWTLWLPSGGSDRWSSFISSSSSVIEAVSSWCSWILSGNDHGGSVCERGSGGYIIYVRPSHIMSTQPTKPLHQPEVTKLIGNIMDVFENFQFCK